MFYSSFHNGNFDLKIVAFDEIFSTMNLASGGRKLMVNCINSNRLSNNMHKWCITVLDTQNVLRFIYLEVNAQFFTFPPNPNHYLQYITTLIFALLTRKNTSNNIVEK